MPSLGNFLHTQLVLKIPIPSTSFDGKVVVVTGGNSGLGKETVKHFVRLGAARVIIACRDVGKGKQVKLDLETTLNCNPDVVEVWEVDTESPSSVRALVSLVNKLPRLDVLINNAGIQTLKFETSYNTERTLAVNVIGTFLLAVQLIPKLKQSAKTYGVTPHMTFVGSALYDVAKYPEDYGDDIFTYFADKAHVDAMNQYNLSKLILLYVMIKLASIVSPIKEVSSSDSPSIIVNSLDPCFCKTGLASGLTGGFKAVFTAFEFLFARPAEEGSRLVVAAASGGKETHGAYMRAGAVQQYASFITNDDGIKRSRDLWEQLIARLEQLEPGISSNLGAVPP